jgi:hypothetical protein
VRTYARYTTPAGVKGWQEVDTAADGSNDMVFVVTLIQVLLLNLGESPPSVQQRVWPDFYVARTQRQFSSYFASLIISAQRLAAEPTYNVDLVTNQGVRINVGVPITQLSQRAPGTPGAV